MYSVKFWKEFNNRPKLNSKSVKRVITDKYVYQISDSDNPQLNKVTYIQEGNLNDIFDELHEIYKEKKNGFEVGVRESDHPDLHNYLLEHGYEKSVVSENRILELSETVLKELEPKINNSFELKELNRDDMDSDEIYKLLKSCFPDMIKSKEQHISVNDAMFGQAEAMSSVLKNYALYDSKTPIAYSSLFDMGEFKGKHLAMLSGAATHPDYRNQNLYTSMLYLRCKEAMELGVDVLYIQADMETSSPIVAKYGFKVVDVLTEYLPK